MSRLDSYWYKIKYLSGIYTRVTLNFLSYHNKSVCLSDGEDQNTKISYFRLVCRPAITWTPDHSPSSTNLGQWRQVPFHSHGGTHSSLTLNIHRTFYSFPSYHSTSIISDLSTNHYCLSWTLMDASIFIFMKLLKYFSILVWMGFNRGFLWPNYT